MSVDSKRLMSKKYRTWRVLQAPGVWAQLYIERGKALSKHPGAIIFPEQILCCDRIYAIRPTNEVQGTSSVSVSVIENPKIYFIGSKLDSNAVSSPEEIYDFEFRNQERAEISKLLIGSVKNHIEFPKPLWFSNKKAAARWVRNYVESSLS